LWWSSAFATAVGAALFAATRVACAADVASAPVAPRQFPVVQVFTFLFLMLGPFKIIGPFAKITKGADTVLTRRIAVRATLFASAALLIAALLGESLVSKYRIPLPILALAAGIILFLVALRQILEQFSPPQPRGAAAGTVPAEKALTSALAPLAFPTIVTPYGIAALVIFLAFAQSLEARLLILAIVAVIMVLNLIAMLFTQRLMPGLALGLTILGAVLGIVQVALGLQIINNALRALGTL
jgi:small neutral amino acid transporter SnatA (MarC family)